MSTALRNTGQRAAILNLLTATEVARSARELHGRLAGGVALATVYRTVNLLVDQGVVDAIRRPSGELAYRVCASGHHHHLTCRRCDKVVELRDCTIDKWAGEVARRHGFSTVEHQAELSGICGECAREGE